MQVRDDISKRNVFISWTESDKEIKNKICKRLIKGGVTVLESKEECSGDFEEWSKCAAVSASVFILILTENLIDKKTSYVKDEVREWRKATGDNFANRIIIVCPKYKITEKFVDENNQPVIGEDVKVSCIEYGENGVDDNVLNEIYNKTVMRIVGRMRAVYFTKSSKVSSIDISRMLGINQNDITYQFAEYNDLYITRTINCEGENYNKISSLLNIIDTKILFVTAPGGSGKSCYISQIFKELGQSDSEEDSLVFSISCVDASKELNKRKTEDKSDYSILLDILRKQFIKECGIGESYYTEENFLTLLNNSKKIVVVFDALDEVPNAGLVKKLAKAIVDLSKYGEDKIDIIITDRTDINRNLFRGAKIAKLNSFNDEDISQYCKSISRYLKNADLNEIIINDVDNAEVLEKINNTEDDVKRNPLMLTQILLLYAFTGEIKTGVVEILNSIVEIMFKSENRKELFGIDDKVPKNLLEILSAFAYERHICIVEGKKMSKKKVERIFDRLLNIKYVNLDQASLSELLKILFKSMARKFISVFGKIQQRVDGIGNLTKDIVRGEDLTDYLEYRSFYDPEKDSFCHARYGEYFVARYYCNAIFDEDGNIVNKDKLIELLSHCGNYYWKDIINYFVQLSGIAEIVIPENVTRLCGGLFSNCSKLKRVVLNKNIINIPEKAFYNCVSLEEIHTDNKNINSVKSYAFSGCEKLNKFESLSNVKTIGENAFYGCKGLKEIALINVKTLGNDAFLGCSNVEKVKIPGGLIKIGERAFSGCSSVVEINIGEGVESIGRLAFDECSALKEIVLPDSIKSIEYAAFSSCCSLEKVTLPSKLTEIADGLFSGCSLLCVISLPEGIIAIGDYAFEDCKSLSKIVVPSSVKQIGYRAFRNCIAMRYAIISHGVSVIKDEAFESCAAPSLYFEENFELFDIKNINGKCVYGFEKYIESDNGVIYGLKNDLATVVSYQPYSYKEVNIPNEIAFNNSVYSVSEIAENAFSNKKNLTKIKIAKTIKRIALRAFYWCNALKYVIFEEESQLETIGDEAFYWCDLYTITLPDNLKEIGKNAFSCNQICVIYCQAIKQDYGYEWSRKNCFSRNKQYYPVVWDCNNNVIADDGNIYTVSEDGIMYSLYDCKATVLRNTIKKNGDFEIPQTIQYDDENYIVVSISDNAFYGDTFESVIIPPGVTNIGDRSFCGNSMLKKVVFAGESKLESISDYAFGSCKSLKTIFLPARLVHLGYCVFGGCKSLMSIIVDENNLNFTSIDGHLYNKDVTRLIRYTDGKDKNNYIMPDSVQIVCERAFEDSNVETIKFSPNIKSIKFMAMSWCKGLKKLMLPESLEEIEGYAFVGCSALEEISVEEENKKYKSIDGNLLSKDERILIKYSTANQRETFRIPDSVQIIASAAFMGAKHLQHLEMSRNLTTISEQAFEGCDSLYNIIIPATVTSVAYNWRLPKEIKVACEASLLPAGWADKHENANVKISEFGRNNIVKNKEYDYILRDGEAVLTKYKGQSKVVTIPSYIDGHKVVSFGSTFSYVDGWKIDDICDFDLIEKIVIPETVSIIGPGAFAACENLIEINVNENNLYFKSKDGNLYSKDGKIFIAYASGKEENVLKIPDGVTEIYPHALGRSLYLRRIFLPQGLIFIGKSAFEKCYYLSEINIPKSVRMLDGEIFGRNSKLTICFEKEKITEQLYRFTDIKDCGPLIYDYNNNSIADNGYKYITLDNIKYWLKGGNAEVAFVDNMTGDVVIPASIIYEGKSYSVNKIKSYAFSCIRLKNIWIPDSITTIRDAAFYNCKGLTSVYYKGDIAGWCGIMFDSESANPLFCGANLYIDNFLVKDLVIPGSVTNIGKNAFSNCKGITSITMHASVTEIKENAFRNCKGLTSVTISASVTDIGKNAFSNCEGLTSITIPASVESIGENAFSYCTRLSFATFEDKVEWFSYCVRHNIIRLSRIGDLSNAMTAATYLKSTFSHYCWKKLK